jgi:ADP-heptose:LPS heptosyltransferase
VLRARRRLARAKPQLSVDFEQFAAAGALLARTAHVPQRIGFVSGAKGRDGLLTVRVPFRRDAHASRSFRDLAEAAGVAPGAYVPGALAPTAAGAAEAAALVPAADGRPLVVLHPGSGDNFPGRRWSEAGFSAVGRRAAEAHGALVVVTGTAAEADLCARVAAAVGPDAVSTAGGLSLEGLVGLLARASALVSNDTAPVHLASALGRPVLALFGPNTPVLYGPLSKGSRTLYRALPCSPCLTVESYRSSRCRIPTCMGAIPTGEACAALSAILTEAAALPAPGPSCARA